MNQRERALSAINGYEVFPIPVDVFENGIHWELEKQLKKHFKLAESDYEGLLRSLNAHIRFGMPLYIGQPLEEIDIPEEELSYPNKSFHKNIWGAWEGLGTFSSGQAIKNLQRPLESARTVDDIKINSWPNPDWFDYERIGWMQDEADQYTPIAQWAIHNNEFARSVGDWCPIFSRIMELFGMETGLINIVARPDLIRAAINYICEFYEEYYRRLAQTCHDYADILYYGDDFASQQGLLLNPQMWREYFLPCWERLFAIAHDHGMRSMMHMCGGVREVLGDLIDVGLDIYDVVQLNAKGNDPEELKREFGADITFYGGMDTQKILPYGTPKEIRYAVRQLVDTFGKGGGFILTSSHFMMDDVPIENVLAFYEEAQEYKT